jgi:hypothetical protein
MYILIPPHVAPAVIVGVGADDLVHVEYVRYTLGTHVVVR